MKSFFAATMSAALVSGLAGSVIAYRSATADPVSLPARASNSTPARIPVVDQPVVRRWAPCAEPATLEKGVCVTHVVRTVILAETSPNPGAGTAEQAAPAPTKPGTGTAGELESDDTDDDDMDADGLQQDQQVDHEDDAGDDRGDEVDADDDHDDDPEDDPEDDHEDDHEDDAEED